MTGAPGQEPLGRVDALLERAYRRLGWRILLAHFSLAWVFGGAVGLAGLLGLARLEGLPVSKKLEGIGIVLLAWAVCFLLGYAGTRRLLRPLAEWFTEGRDRSGADEAWRAVHRLPLGISLWNGLVAIVLALPAAILAGGRGSAPEPAFYLAATLLGLVGLAVVMCVGVFGLQLMLRPLIRDVGRSLDPPPSPEGGASVRLKLLVAVPLLALSAALGAMVLTIEPGVDWGDFSVKTLGVMLLVLAVIPVAMLLAHSALQPLDDLLRASERLKRGDFETRVPELSGDEYGALARSFNEAMVGLAERQRFAEANERLLEEVRASRVRIVAASDAERRRVERNIHDGAQQRLVALALDLQMLGELAASSPPEEVQALAEQSKRTLSEALDELRELARGLHPSVLATDGLPPALEQLASRAPVPVIVSAPAERFPEPVESAAYFVASEALANVAKYARASQVKIAVERRDGRVAIEIADDGVGGAAPEPGSGLAGLADRVAALDGTLSLESPPGKGTKVRAELPLA